jgi:hypothetical protein
MRTDKSELVYALFFGTVAFLTACQSGVNASAAAPAATPVTVASTVEPPATPTEKNQPELEFDP